MAGQETDTTVRALGGLVAEYRKAALDTEDLAAAHKEHGPVDRWLAGKGKR